METEDENNPEASPKIDIEGMGDQKPKLERMHTEPCDDVEPFHTEEGKKQNDESMLSSINLNEDSGQNLVTNKESFFSNDDPEDDTPAFGKEPESEDSGVPATGVLSRTATTEERDREKDMNKGILVHSLLTLFEEIKKREAIENRIFIIKCAYFEIYNDQVFDLLNEQFI